MVLGGWHLGFGTDEYLGVGGSIVDQWCRPTEFFRNYWVLLYRYHFESGGDLYFFCWAYWLDKKYILAQAVFFVEGRGEKVANTGSQIFKFLISRDEIN